jgi:DNA end-binding protein Ku
MRALWKGAISFGLVNIPVRMYTASESNTLDLDMLRKDDLCQVRFARVCREDGKEIPYEDIVKGYKYKGGDYVVLTDKDFESANVEKSHTIDIIHFVNESNVDSVFFEKSYYLEPDRSGAKSYALLREAIKRSKKAGLARFVIKNREHLGLLKAYDDIIVLNQIRFKNEIRSYGDLNLPAAKSITSKELQLALSLIENMTHKFNPKDYKDTYFEELKKIIEQKAKGRKIKPKGKAPKSTGVKNLMTLLKKSLDKKAA